MLGQIKMATHNLFALTCKHLQRKISPQETGQTLLQLDKVQHPITVPEWKESVHVLSTVFNASFLSIPYMA